MTALYFVARYPQARIFAIEPNPDNFALHKRNTASEPRITALQACVTPLPRQTVFIETSGPAWGFRTNSAQRGVPVRGVSLAELMDDYGLARIDFLKIDIEGAERDVFAEGEFLTRVSAIVAELHGGYTLAHLNRDLHVSTVLLTMYDGRTKLADQVAGEVRRHFGRKVLRTIVPRSVKVSEAPGFGMTIIDYDPGSRGAMSYVDAARELALAGAAVDGAPGIGRSDS